MFLAGNSYCYTTPILAMVATKEYFVQDCFSEREAQCTVQPASILTKASVVVVDPFAT